MQRVVLAYSGSVETSAAIPWLKERTGADIIALTLDFGQGRELEAVRNRALVIGAVRAHVLDVRDQFAREFILPSLKADALHDGLVLARPLTRPLIARKLVEIAEIEEADGVAHGGARLDDQPSSLRRLIAAVTPAMNVVNVPATDGRDGGCRVESNLWARWIQCDGEVPEGVYTLTKAASDCPAEAAVVDIAFDRGVPKAINGVFMPLLELIASLGTIAGAHGVGRFTADGESCEAPAALLLHAAHRELQARAAIAGDLDELACAVSRKYVEVIHRGLWFTPLREALDAFVEKVQERVTGTVRLKLFKGELLKL